MKILILYTLRQKSSRKTIKEHLYSFKKYAKEHQYVYVNIGPSGIPVQLFHIKFDMVIYHYTFLAGERFIPGSAWQNKIKGVEKIEGYKIALPQDEYCYTGRLVDFFKSVSINLIGTCFYKQADIELAYSKFLDNDVKYVKVFTGYIDDELRLAVVNKVKPYAERKIDIGYRASMLPANLGKHGQLKFELVNIFNERLKGSSLHLDIKSSNNSLTNEGKSAVKLGDTWNQFLMDCKAFIGCEGGSSLLDFDGSIQDKVSEFVKRNPNAKFEAIEAACFPGDDYNIACFAISPRHFEAIVTKTLQILVEGFYGGILKPDVHYLSLKRDYSNFDEVIHKLSDTKLCQEIIDKSYNDIVLTGLFSYSTFIKDLFEQVPIITGPSIAFSSREKFLISFLNFREWYIEQLNRLGVAPTLYENIYGLYVKLIKPLIKRNQYA